MPPVQKNPAARVVALEINGLYLSQTGEQTTYGNSAFENIATSLPVRRS